jgi:hypothetical protein
MAGQHLAQVHPGQHVPVEHHHGVVTQFRHHIGDPTTGAHRVVLGDVLDLQPEFGPVAELVLERRGLVRGAEDDMLDTGLGDAGEQVRQKRQTRGRQHRLGRRQGQRPQPGALSADEHHGVDF